jgi:hypothetical protein
METPTCGPRYNSAEHTAAIRTAQKADEKIQPRFILFFSFVREIGHFFEKRKGDL